MNSSSKSQGTAKGSSDWQIHTSAVEENGGCFRLAPKTGAKGSVLVVFFQDQVRCFENLCPHMDLELDWMPGKVFDQEKRFLVCANHGARFDPLSGLCISGPCKGSSLSSVNFNVNDNLITVEHKN